MEGASGPCHRPTERWALGKGPCRRGCAPPGEGRGAQGWGWWVGGEQVQAGRGGGWEASSLSCWDMGPLSLCALSQIPASCPAAPRKTRTSLACLAQFQLRTCPLGKKPP